MVNQCFSKTSAVDSLLFYQKLELMSDPSVEVLNYAFSGKHPLWKVIFSYRYRVYP